MCSRSIAVFMVNEALLLNKELNMKAHYIKIFKIFLYMAYHHIVHNRLLYRT